MKEKKITYYKNFYTKFLKNLISTYLNFENIPDSIDVSYLKKIIIEDGFVSMFEYKNKPVVSRGALSGLDLYYRPIKFTVANPYVFVDNPLIIGKDCEVGYISNDHISPKGLKTFIDMYATRLAEIDMSIDTSVRNSRVSQIVIVDDDKEARRTAQLLDEMYNEGRATVLSYKTSFSREEKPALYPISAKDNIVTSELADARRNILSDFYSMLGINTIAVDKKERTNLAEMESNNLQLLINRNSIEENIKDWVERCNTRFGLNMSFKLMEAEPAEVEEVMEGGAEL